MTEFNDIVDFQKKFDKDHGWSDEFDSYDGKFFDRLQYATISLSGEVGEFSNFLKKIIREKNLSSKIDDIHMKAMKEELIDIFIYLIILSVILKIDIPEGYKEKMEFNQEKYRRFER